MKFFNIILFTLAFCLILSGCADGDISDTDDPSDALDTVDTTADISSDSETEETGDTTDTDEADTTDTEAPETETTAPDTDETEPQVTELPEIEGLTVISDGVVSIDAERDSNKASHFPLETLNHFLSTGYNNRTGEYIGKYVGEPIHTVYVGDAVLKLTPIYDEYDGRHDNFRIDSVTVLGQSVVPVSDKDNFYVSLYGYIQAFWTDGYFIISSIHMDTYGTAYVFYNGGYVEFQVNNNSTATVFYNEDGKLVYQRTATKYYSGGVSYLDMLVARDEFFRDSGTVEITQGNVILHSTKKQTFEEAHDLEAEWANWKEALGGKYLEMTLDEYLAENAEKYKRTEDPTVQS